LIQVGGGKENRTDETTKQTTGVPKKVGFKPQSEQRKRKHPATTSEKISKKRGADKA